MASGSPICITSSPPSAIQPIVDRAPTTNCARHASVSNSSALLSPSAFLDTRQLKPLTGDPRATATHATINAGFPTASALNYDGMAENVGGASRTQMAALLAPIEGVASEIPQKKRRKPRKRPKSDSFILNSEEPESADTEQVHNTNGSNVAADQLKQHVLPGRDAWAGWASVSEHQPAETSVASNFFTLPQLQPVTAQDVERELSCSVVEQDVADSPVRPLAELLSSYAYVDKSALTRAVPAQASTKRRKIELIDSATVTDVAEPQRNIALVPVTTASKQAKKLRSPKKKAQTITALAMAPYQTSKVHVDEQPVVSEYFVSDTVPASKSSAALEVLPEKPKKARKSRKKQENHVETGAEPRKLAKKKKVKVRLNEANHAPELYSPKRACEQISRQDFLFGTSSQLAVDESPTFIRDVQSAMAVSETVPGSIRINAQHDALDLTSAALQGQVVAPGHKKRELWLSASRDFNGGILRDDSGLSRVRAKAKIAHTLANTSAEHQSTIPACSNGTKAVTEADCEIEQPPELGLNTLPEPVFPNNADDDSWALLSSSSPVPPIVADPPTEPVKTTSSSSHRLPPSSDVLLQSSLKPATRTSSPRRKALEMLDANINIALSDGLKKRIHTPQGVRVSQIAPAATTSTLKRPVGRPRKIVNVTNAGIPGALPPVKRQRGRPPKHESNAPTAEILPQVSNAVEPSSTHPAPTLRTISAQNTKSWANIDEISDDEVPNTPSPRRRRSASDGDVTPLEMSPHASPAIQNKTHKEQVMTTTSVKLRWTDEQWPEIYNRLSPQITSTIKAFPRSTDQKKPNWLQKILLYDPIVLEDLTAWLNDQHITISVRRPVKKAVLKGRNKKKKLDDAPSEEASTLDYEVVSEPLQAWMVQKWCEEKSICCLWREGLRGGVKARY